ncbi:MAG: GntR family transcriptional regulator [Streptosporangiaceae bacterium]
MAEPTALGGPVDKSSPVPLYFQIAENLRGAIENGTLAAGEKLGNEIQIGERLAVSRPTVRQAIQRLVQDGLLTRQRGVGTVVTRPGIQRKLALSSLHEDLREAGRRPATTVLSVAAVAATQEVATALGVQPGTRVLAIERLREADGEPLAVMRNHLAPGLLDTGDVADLLSRSGLYETLRRQGIRFHAAEETIGARKATATEARLLQAARGSTVLTMTRVATDPTGRPIEYGVHAYLAERHSFRVQLGPDALS